MPADPFGQLGDRQLMPSKPRSPLWNRLSPDRHRAGALRHAEPVGVLAQLAAGEVVARAGLRTRRALRGRALADAGLRVTAALALVRLAALRAADAGVVA